MKDLLNFKKIPMSYIVVAIVLITALSVGLTINRVNNVTRNDNETPPPSDEFMFSMSRGGITVEEYNEIRDRSDVSIVRIESDSTAISDRHEKLLQEIQLQDRITKDLEKSGFIQNSLVVVKTGDEPMFEESSTTVTTVVTGDSIEKFTDEQVLMIVGIIQDNITGIKLQNIQIVDDLFNNYDINSIINKKP